MTCHHLLAPLKMFPQPRVCATHQFWLQLPIPPQLTTGKGNSWKKKRLFLIFLSLTVEPLLTHLKAERVVCPQ